MAKRKKKFCPIRLSEKQSGLVFGKGTGVTKKQAQIAFEKGFMKSAQKKKKTKYKGCDGLEFEWY